MSLFRRKEEPKAMFTLAGGSLKFTLVCSVCTASFQAWIMCEMSMLVVGGLSRDQAKFIGSNCTSA